MELSVTLCLRIAKEALHVQKAQKRVQNLQRMKFQYQRRDILLAPVFIAAGEVIANDY